MGIRWRGIPQAVAKIERFKEAIPDRAQDAAEDYVDLVKAQADVLVPKSTGALLGTGHTGIKSGAGTTRSAFVHYGDSSTDRVGVFYAAAVHERFSHRHAAPTQAKYVEQPLYETIPAGTRILAGYMWVAKRESF